MALTTDELEKIIDDLTAQMAEEGYSVGDGNDIYEGVAKFIPCPKCKNTGNEYCPFINDKYRTTRAFAVCTNCGYVGKF